MVVVVEAPKVHRHAAYNNGKPTDWAWRDRLNLSSFAVVARSLHSVLDTDAHMLSTLPAARKESLKARLAAVQTQFTFNERLADDAFRRVIRAMDDDGMMG